MTHKCVGKLAIIGSYNGLLPGRHQAIIWANAGILLIGPIEIFQWNLNTLRQRQHGRHIADDTFKGIFLIKISLKFVPRGSIKNIPALVQIMAWRRPGNRPQWVNRNFYIFIQENAFENVVWKMATILTRPQWVNQCQPFHSGLIVLKGDLTVTQWNLEGVSLTFHELSKIFSRNVCIAKILHLMRISSWNFVCVPKSQCFGHTHKVFAWILHLKCDFWNCIFKRDYFKELMKL